MRRFFLTLTLLSSFWGFCIAQKHYLLKSPNGELIINIEVGDKISYSLQHKGKSVIVSSPISMLLDCDKTLGENPKLKMYICAKLMKRYPRHFISVTRLIISAMS